MITTAVEGTPGSGVFRAVRSSIFAGCAVWLSLVAHVAGGGSAPSAGLVAGLIVLTSGVAALPARRRRGHLSITSALLALQVLLHYAFTCFAGGAVCQVPSMTGDRSVSGHSLSGHGLMAMSGMAMSTMAPTSSMAPSSMAPNCVTPEPLAATTTGMSAMTPAMLGAHALAAVAVALLLGYGERALWWVLTWFLPPAPSTVAMPPVPAVGGPVALLASIRPRVDLLSGGVGRRGPPIGLGAPA